MIGYIYRIINKVTNQSYIGQTTDIVRRINEHFCALKNNKHYNLKLQESWNKYGEENFNFEHWQFQINSPKELNELECQYIDKYNSLKDGFNLTDGGNKPPLHKKVKNEDIVKFLCVQKKYGEGYGKTFEQIFEWAKGTASAAKRRIRYLDANKIFDELSNSEKDKIAEEVFEKYNIKELSLERQLTQGGCAQAYQLTQEHFNFAFAAQELGYKYTPVANYLGIKPATVKDWFNGRSRAKEKQIYLNLSEEEKRLLFGHVKTAELSGNPTLNV